jgi:hypothetical protein
VVVGIATWWGIAKFLPREDKPTGASRWANADLVASGDFQGAVACRECHPAETAHHAHSGHAQTLRPAARTPLARRLDGRRVADPEQSGVTWSYELRDGALSAQRAEAGSIERFVLEFAFGSDRHATTFVTLTDSSSPAPLAREHRLTHFTDGDAIEITPGQRQDEPVAGVGPRGREMSSEVTIKCFGCHASRIDENSAGRGLELEALIPNVTCERCHGPARKHVADARAGRAELAMPFGPGRYTADSLVGLCGQCHRHPSKAPPSVIRADNPQLARFQPVGLLQSKCFRASAGALSCVTCHDPHARSPSDRQSFETFCLKCHSARDQTPCPVSPQAGCIDCHMPRVDTGHRVLFTDHWIRPRKRISLPRPEPSP